MIYLSHGGGIGAEMAAWSPPGWELNFAAEENGFCRAVILKNFPQADLLADKKLCKDYYGRKKTELVFSTAKLKPFSIAGFREGVDAPGDNESLHLLGIMERHAPRWLVWAGVAGALSDPERAFETLLQGLAKLGYGFAYRVLDAQHFGVGMRHRRCYLVAHAAGHWQRAAAVLFDAQSLRRHPAARVEAGDEAEPDLEGGTGDMFHSPAGGIFAPKLAAPPRPASGKHHARFTGGGRTTLIIEKAEGRTQNEEIRVRRLAIVECERLLGLPDDYSKVDGWEGLDEWRYRALGGSLPMPVLRWIGERIEMVEHL